MAKLFQISTPELTAEDLHEALAQMAAGDIELRIPLSPARNELDAIAYGINILAEELTYSMENLAKEREKAQRASESKSTFLAHVSHEIRTPLTVILGFSELLERGATSPEQATDFIRRIRKNCVSLRKLVDQLLDLSKIEAGELALENQCVEIRRLVTDSSNGLEAVACKRNVTLRSCFDPGLAEWVYVDPLRMWQVINNLIGNAVKFSDGTPVNVSVRQEEGRLVLEVEDFGVGMDSLAQKRIFSPFSQADSSISRRFGGTGLGMALSRALCRAMGGDLVLVRSAPGQGSLFRASFAFRPGDRDGAGVVAEKAVTKPLTGFKILLAEDVPDVRSLLVTLLTGAGATVKECANGREAVEKATSDLDAILMDLQMPEMSGREANRELRRSNFTAPIFALTANAMLKEKETCLAEGFTDYITKPVDWEHLVSRLHHHCRP